MLTLEDKGKLIDELKSELSTFNLKDDEFMFILYYLETNNVLQSYLKSHPNCEKSYACIYGSRMYNRPQVKDAIKSLKEKLRVSFEVDPTQYLETLLRIANADIGDYLEFGEEEVDVLDSNGQPVIDLETELPVKRRLNRVHLKDSSKVDTSIILEVKQGKDGITFKLMDKMKAWEALKDYFQWQQQKKEESQTDNNLLAAISGRAAEVWVKNSNPNSDLAIVLKGRE